MQEVAMSNYRSFIFTAEALGELCEYLLNIGGLKPRTTVRYALDIARGMSYMQHLNVSEMNITIQKLMFFSFAFFLQEWFLSKVAHMREDINKVRELWMTHYKDNHMLILLLLKTLGVDYIGGRVTNFCKTCLKCYTNVVIV